MSIQQHAFTRFSYYSLCSWQIGPGLCLLVSVLVKLSRLFLVLALSVPAKKEPIDCWIGFFFFCSCRWSYYLTLLAFFWHFSACCTHLCFVNTSFALMGTSLMPRLIEHGRQIVYKPSLSSLDLMWGSHRMAWGHDGLAFWGADIKDLQL